MIHARGLVQTFHTGQGKKKNEVHAVKGVDLDVAEGEVVGFLGPNGAGKTTTLRMLTTLLRPTAGTATVAEPAVGRSSVVSIRSVVVLPAPLGPRKPTTSPSSTLRSTPSTARTSVAFFPRPVWNVCTSPRASIIGVSWFGWEGVSRCSRLNSATVQG